MKHTINVSSLIKMTLLALFSAGLILVFFVLPAEYNIDPTGVGKKLGLTIFNPQNTSPVASQKSTALNNDTVSITIPAKKGVEYKFLMQKHQKMHYEWLSNGEPLYVDLHGEPEGDTTGYFESYAVATTYTMKGSFTAPFTGSHGWYWRNTSTDPIFIQLVVKGDYIIKGLTP